MDISKKERLAFIYQLRILEALYPEEADYYANHRTALEKGFMLHYDWMFENLYDELSEDECREVIDILDMYRAITFGLNKLKDDDELHNHHLAKFSGFDGNNESRQMAYTRYFIVDLDRFSELKHSDYPNFNSHCPMLDTYRRMLQKWKPLSNKFELSRNEITTVLGA